MCMASPATLVFLAVSFVGQHAYIVVDCSNSASDKNMYLVVENVCEAAKSWAGLQYRS